MVLTGARGRGEKGKGLYVYQQKKGRSTEGKKKDLCFGRKGRQAPTGLQIEKRRSARGVTKASSSTPKGGREKKVFSSLNQGKTNYFERGKDRKEVTARSTLLKRERKKRET